MTTAHGKHKKARGDPAPKLSVQAAKLIDKVLNATDNAFLRQALEEARATVGGRWRLMGWVLPQMGATEESAVASCW